MPRCSNEDSLGFSLQNIDQCRKSLQCTRQDMRQFQTLPAPSPTNHMIFGEVLSVSFSQLLVVIGINCINIELSLANPALSWVLRARHTRNMRARTTSLVPFGSKTHVHCDQGHPVPVGGSSCPRKVSEGYSSQQPVASQRVSVW